MSELHMFHFYFFQLAPKTCSFVVFTPVAVEHGIIVILIKIDILFSKHHVQEHISK